MVGEWPARADDQPYFFLSYHRSEFRPEDGSDPDVWIKKFFRVLSETVHVVTGAPNPGFMDQQTQAGDPWRDRLAAALAGCRVFVPLLSPGYFTSDYCGREWAAFTQRMQMHAPRGALRAPIVPAIWSPVKPEHLPPQVSGMQLIPPGFPRAYTDWGFYGLIKLRRFAAAYSESVMRLARAIGDAADPNLPPGPLIDLSSQRSAFADHHANTAAYQIRVKVAACPGASPNRRIYYYGRSMREWCPYRSRLDATPIARIAERVISDLGYHAVIEPLDEPAPTAQPSPSVIIVDPWAAGNAQIAGKLRAIDRDPTHVVVPWNADDEETILAESRLDEDLYTVLRQSLALKGSAPRVPTLDTFRSVLPKAVNEAISKYFKTAKAYPPPDPPSMDRPTLEGPDA